MSEQRRDNVLDLLPNAEANLRSMLTIIREQRDLLTSLGHPQNFMARQHNGLWLFQRDDRPAPSPSHGASNLANAQQAFGQNTVGWHNPPPANASDMTALPASSIPPPSMAATMDRLAASRSVFSPAIGAETGGFRGDLTAPRNPYQPVSSANFSNEQGWDNTSRGTTNTWVGHRPTQMDCAPAWTNNPSFHSPVGIDTGSAGTSQFPARSSTYPVPRPPQMGGVLSSPTSNLPHPSVYTGLDRSRVDAANAALTARSRGNSRESPRFRPYQVPSDEPGAAIHRAPGSRTRPLQTQTDAPSAPNTGANAGDTVEEEETAEQSDEGPQAVDDADAEGNSDLDAEGDTE